MLINLQLGQIKRIIGATSSSDNSFLIQNIASLENAKEGDLAVILDRGEDSVFDPIAQDKIKNSCASFVLAQKEVVPGKNYILVDDSLAAFQKLVDFVEKQNLTLSKNIEINSSAFIHHSAVISAGAKIGEDTFIGEQVFIGKDVQIGANVKIYPGAKILDGCIVGDNTIIHSGAVIGSDGFGYSITKQGLRKIPQIGTVKIGKNVEIGANSTIDKAAFDQTIVGDGVKLDNMVHIAHNVVIGDHTVILAQTGIAGGVQIGIGCQIGGQVAIKDHIKIGNGAKIVSKSAVMKDVADGAVVCGIPAIPFNDWKKMSVVAIKLPEIFKEFTKFKSFFENKNSVKKSFLKRLFGLK